MSQRDPDNSPPTLNELTIWQRGCAAGIASLVSSVFLNPIDVVKTRMQAQAAAKRSVPSGTAAAPAAAAWCASPLLCAWPRDMMSLLLSLSTPACWVWAAV